MELKVVAANSPSEVGDAALALAAAHVDAICQLPGNLTASAFPSIAQVSQQARIPVFTFQSSQVRAGPWRPCRATTTRADARPGHVAARVMRGESPAGMPFIGFSQDEADRERGGGAGDRPDAPAAHRRQGRRSGWANRTGMEITHASQRRGARHARLRAPRRLLVRPPQSRALRGRQQRPPPHPARLLGTGLRELGRHRACSCASARSWSRIDGAFHVVNPSPRRRRRC